MAFIDLLKAKDDAITHDDECADAEIAAVEALELAMHNHQESATAVLTAHKAIHDLLAERGEHYILDGDGTFVVYRATDEVPGYVPSQPIPGRVT